METDNDFYITLPSSSEGVYYKNKCNNFKVKLKHSHKLCNGHWKVALTKITFPHTWSNLIQKGASAIIVHNKRAEVEAAKVDSKIALVHDTYVKKPHQDFLEAMEKFFKERFQWQSMHWELWHFTVVELESGYYHNAGEIAQHIVNNFKLQNPNSTFPFECLYESNGNKVQFFGPDGVIFRKADKFVTALGFDTVVKSVNDTEIIWSEFKGKGKIDKVDTLYVYSSIVEFNDVGDSETPLLTIVPVKGKHGEVIEYEPNRPEYKTVAQNYISEIEIQICKNTGQDIKFESGEVSLVLHFKRDGIGI